MKLTMMVVMIMKLRSKGFFGSKTFLLYQLFRRDYNYFAGIMVSALYDSNGISEQGFFPLSKLARMLVDDGSDFFKSRMGEGMI
jgi:hypothetical protein